jgi:hypothetical protein
VRRLRALGLARGSLVLALAISTVVFAVMSYEGHGGGIFGGVLIEILLIAFVQQGVTRVERAGFALAAVSLGLFAFIAGRVAAEVAA